MDNEFVVNLARVEEKLDALLDRIDSGDRQSAQLVKLLSARVDSLDQKYGMHVLTLDRDIDEKTKTLDRETSAQVSEIRETVQNLRTTLRTLTFALIGAITTGSVTVIVELITRGLK